MKSLAQQLAPIQAAITTGDIPQGVSKPRCMCHNKYLRDCPGKDNWVCKFRRCGAVNSKGRWRCKICGTVRGNK